MSKNKNKEISRLIKKSEFGVGLATILLIVSSLFVTHVIKVTPLPKTESLTSTTPLKDGEERKNRENEKTIEAVSNYYSVLKGDSYFRITKRTCGNGKFYKFVARLNGNKALHIGDSVLVYCSF